MNGISDLLARYRVTDGKHFRLSRHDPSDTAGLDIGKEQAKALLAQGVADLARLQDMLYAQDRWSVLIIFQAMDAAGKDSAIKHVFSGINPQGCHVVSFKAPTATELDHDFLWRHMRELPARGMIGIHNRSWYEEVLVVRVHPDLLARQKLPDAVRGKRVFEQRLADIAAIEAYLARQGTLVLKFFLNVSRDEQRKRFLERIEDPAKNWKFEPRDIAERARWDDYMAAYEAAIRATAAPHAPWFVVPADAKWFTRLVVAAAIGEALRGLGLAYPEPDAAQRAALEAARIALIAD
jgi:PPK2 family polyphosphate:nucleotide phosphotransferase